MRGVTPAVVVAVVMAMAMMAMAKLKGEAARLRERVT